MCSIFACALWVSVASIAAFRVLHASKNLPMCEHNTAELRCYFTGVIFQLNGMAKEVLVTTFAPSTSMTKSHYHYLA